MNNMNKLFEVIANVLSIDIQNLDELSSPDNIENWDSLAMVIMVAEFEQAFGVQFDILEIVDFQSIGAIKEILIKKGVAI